MEKQKLIYKVSMTETLRRMEVGQDIEIGIRQMKTSQIRSLATRLSRKEGKKYTCSESGRIDSTIVTRIK